MRIWIDTDIGSDVDDALALAYVLRRPELELVGVSTVFGDVGLRSRIARHLLDLAGATGVPVLDGLGVPITSRRPGRMFGHEGDGLFEVTPPERRITDEAGGTRRIARLGEAIGQAAPDVILAIGPLTNLAALTRAGFDLPPTAIMGGRFDGDLPAGRAPAIAEWNWYCDPDAVRTVLSAGHRSTPLVVPAEVTFRTAFGPDDLTTLADEGELGATLARLCRRWLDAQREGFGHDEPKVHLHDPLTAAVLVEPSLCTFAERSAVVDDGGAAVAGDDGAPTVLVAVDVDPDAVRRHLLATLSRCG